MNINVWTFSGRLTRDPAMKDVGDNKVCNFGVAINEYAGKGKDKSAIFVECNVWGNRGEYLTRFSKGDEIIVTGKLAQRVWQDKIILGCNVSEYSISGTGKVQINNSEESVSQPSITRNDSESDEEDEIPF